MPVHETERIKKNTGCSRRLFWSLIAGLVLLTYLAFNTVLENDFIDFDDPDYVTENDYVLSGLNPTSVSWAFRTTFPCNWTPLTWLSHMLDVELYGLNPAGHHLTSLLIHIGTTLLLFGWFAYTTKAVWPSAITALLFAIHPLRVESVAWIAERKDVLCGFWAIVTVWAYVYFTRQRTPGRYLLVVLSLAGGLMSKPMLVSWPFVLLLLDIWPLRRLQTLVRRKKGGPSEPAPDGTCTNKQSLRHLILEKIPLLAIALLFSVITYIAQRDWAMADRQWLPLSFRLQNAVFSYVRYLGKMVLPIRLAPLYPLDESIPPAAVAGSVAALLAVTILAGMWARKKPYLLIGWLWYVGMLVPVIGIVQVGLQSIADRYTYLPSIGITFAVVWLIRSWMQQFRLRRICVGIGTALAAAGLLFGTWIQTYYWKNTLTLFQHTLRVTADNHPVKLYYARALSKAGEVDEAIELTLQVHQAFPNLAEAAAQLGSLYLQTNNTPAAIEYLQTALAMRPKNADEYLGRLGAVYALQEEYETAAHYYQQALQINPRKAALLNDLAVVRKNQEHFPEAVALWKQAVSCEPFFAPALKNLAWTLATCRDETVRDPNAAFAYAQRACAPAGADSPAHLDTLAAACAARGDYPKAAALIEEALCAPSLRNSPEFKAALEERLRLYKNGRPYRE